MMGVCLSDQYLGTCLPPSITKHRWVDVLSHFSLLQQGCVAPGASQVFGHLVLQINPCRNLMLCAINSSYSAAWHVEQDFPPRAVAGRENGDKWVMEGDIFYFGCSDPGMKISALLPWWVLNWELLNSPVTLMGKTNEFVAGIFICELGKSWTSLDLSSPREKKERGELQAEGGITPVCWMDKCVSSCALRCCRTVPIAGFVSSRLTGTVVHQGDAGCASNPDVQHLGPSHPAFFMSLLPSHENCSSSSDSATYGIFSICAAQTLKWPKWKKTRTSSKKIFWTFLELYSGSVILSL